jgi:hypothetical protein
MLFVWRAVGLSSFWAFLFSVSSVVTALNASDGKGSVCRCFPGDPCWPSESEWITFNETINGKLIATIPIASPCHDNAFTPFNAAQCAELQSTWYYPETHYSSSSSVMTEFFANLSCDPFTPRSAQCVLGTYIQYAVDADSVDDYQKTIALVMQRNIRLVIRNTGHDYLGKSTGAGSLGLWTHHMKDISFFDYNSCGSNYTGKAMRVGAGVQSFEAIEAAHNEGLVVVVGNCQTVGLVGGYTQGGGHSLLSSTLGLSADQVLEWEVVTASGQHLIATPLNNSDLYWALSGGGGGNYAAVLSMTVKAYPDFRVVAGANLTFTVGKLSGDTFFGAVETWLQNLPTIVDAGASVLWTLADGFFQVAPVIAPGLTTAQLRSLLRPTLFKLNNSGIQYSEQYSHPMIIVGSSLSATQNNSRY